MLLAFDDTDSTDGGCTTHLAFHVLLALPDLALRGLPRLVRLNPNVPWKTRGNGAVVLPLGTPEGPQTRVGELRGREVLAFPEGRPAVPAPEVLDAVCDVLWDQARPEADPGVALFPEAPPSAAYWQGVRSVVSPRETQVLLHGEPGALWRSRGEGRGLTGAVAAAAWPGPPASYEFIAYREPARWGTPRELDGSALGRLDEAGTTFHTWDPAEERPACIPSTPCPVLCGLRGTDPDRLRDAATRALAGATREPIDGWLLWATNQASGDHVRAVSAVGEAGAHETVAVEATVQDAPQDAAGGHVFVALQDAAGAAFQAAAFEPTKRFRDTVRALAPGDAVTVVGAFKDGTVQLEKLEIRSQAPRRRKISNPTCCDKSMKSRGAGGGYKCPVCGRKVGAEAAAWSEEAPAVAPGCYEVPVMARRHLHRPLTLEHGLPITTS